MFHAFLPALSIVSVTDCLVGVVFLLLSKKISQTLLFLEHTVISKSGGRQLDLLILDTSFKTLETIEFLCTKGGLLGRMTHEFDHHKDNECLEEWSNRYRALETVANCLNKPYAE
ncbi:hypothetical protein YC2023_102069 [Brassica napus]